MIAIPLDAIDATTISDEYVKAPFFALLDTITGYYKVIENTKKDSLVVEMIHDYGADSTVCHMMEDAISDLCSKRGVLVYEAPNGTVSIDEVFQAVNIKQGLFS